MTTLQQLAWCTHVHHYRYVHMSSPTASARQTLFALQCTFSEIVGRLIERGDKLPDSAWREYQ